MIVKDCVIKAAKYLELSDLAYQLQYADNETDEAKEFLDMAKDVIHEICTDYFPLIKTETVEIDDDGVFQLKVLQESALDIIAVKKEGVSCPFSIKYNRIETCVSGLCELTYSFAPEIKYLSTPVPFGANINERIVAYGLAAEYCVIKGLDDAIIWDKRYKDALKKAIRQRREKRIKGRHWLW